ncbi:type VI secretion system tube protein Hcp [Flexibacterium corallicola]|uniref:type VI secretion system tube protein Hcp n=1 Tax=Flexibacterium corallicola TaxID=3037259 RepID=UPI00286F27DA|nr:type VI secretion system tube protein Hcp [Pseudovibrio sp. M1P-2-3]
MSGYYMRIDGITDFKGMATVKEIAGKKGFFPISNMGFSFSRSIFVAVGSAGDAETGIPAVGDINIERGNDAASAILETMFFAPGAKGKTIEIVTTKTKNDGKGLQPTLVLTLEEARISSYAYAGEQTSLSIAYTVVSIAHYFETESGEVVKSDTVKFDLKSGELVSGNADAQK